MPTSFWEWILFYLVVGGMAGGLIIPFIHLFLIYQVWYHKWRKHKYRIVQVTSYQSWSQEIPDVHYTIQRKRLLGGWKDNPDIPGYGYYGEFSIWKTHRYQSLEKAQKWMDKIHGIEHGGRKETPIA